MGGSQNEADAFKRPQKAPPIEMELASRYPASCHDFPLKIGKGKLDTKASEQLHVHPQEVIPIRRSPEGQPVGRTSRLYHVIPLSHSVCRQLHLTAEYKEHIGGDHRWLSENLLINLTVQNPLDLRKYMRATDVLTRTQNTTSPTPKRKCQNQMQMKAKNHTWIKVEICKSEQENELKKTKVKCQRENQKSEKNGS
ncbi:hypothetical protein PIB30_095340 [Stylosanthes scabra]|uniref:Uncharacterized protein n=1 Tax=Stylosanthes scabra TaxID=79078 RepID=A0ABU6TVE1_9FABA|nr:hypothetical protein [Stylosanthes scabra]